MHKPPLGSWVTIIAPQGTSGKEWVEKVEALDGVKNGANFWCDTLTVWLTGIQHRSHTEPVAIAKQIIAAIGVKQKGKIQVEGCQTCQRSEHEA